MESCRMPSMGFVAVVVVVVDVCLFCLLVSKFFLEFPTASCPREKLTMHFCFRLMNVHFCTWLYSLIYTIQVWNYSKEPKSVTSFNKLTFFHANIKQSKVEDSFQLAYDWIKSVQRNVNKSKVVTILGSLL